MKMNKAMKRFLDPTGLSEKAIEKGLEKGKEARAKEATHTATLQTGLASEDVIVRAVQFFTGANWKATTQSSRVATFSGRPRGVGKWIFASALFVVGVFLSMTLIGAILGVPMIIAGIVLVVRARIKLMKFQNLTVAAESQGSGSAVTVNYPGYAQKLVEQFLGALPKVGA